MSPTVWLRLALVMLLGLPVVFVAAMWVWALLGRLLDPLLGAAGNTLAAVVAATLVVVAMGLLLSWATGKARPAP